MRTDTRRLGIYYSPLYEAHNIHLYQHGCLIWTLRDMRDKRDLKRTPVLLKKKYLPNDIIRSG